MTRYMTPLRWLKRLLGAKRPDQSEQSGLDDRRARVAADIKSGAMEVDDLIACLRNDDSRIRCDACKALGRIGDMRAIPPLIEMLGFVDPRLKDGNHTNSAASFALAKIGEVDGDEAGQGEGCAGYRVGY